MLYRKSGKSPYYNEARRSLSGESFFELQDIGSIAQSRDAAFKLGTNPYVSFCDDDDYVMNIAAVKTFLTEYPNTPALFTNSQIYSTASKTNSQTLSEDFQYNKNELFSEQISIHQLVVIKREIALEASDNVIKKMTEDNNFQAYEYALYFEIALIADWAYLNQKCYTWRMWNSNIQDHYKTGARCKVWAQYYKDKLSK